MVEHRRHIMVPRTEKHNVWERKGKGGQQVHMTNMYLILATQRARTKKRRIRNKSTSPVATPRALETPTDDDRDPVKTDETAEVESEAWPYASVGTAILSTQCDSPILLGLPTFFVPGGLSDDHDRDGGGSDIVWMEYVVLNIDGSTSASREYA